MGNEKGTEALEGVLDTLVNFGEGLANADRNGDGHVSRVEIFGAITVHSAKLFAMAPQLGEAVEEGKDLDVNESKDLLISMIDEVDRFTKAQKVWLKGIIENTAGVMNHIRIAKSVW